MAQKWNLGDIVPPERERRSARSVQGEHSKAVPDMRRTDARPRMERPMTPRDMREARELSPHAEVHERFNERYVEEPIDDDIAEIKIKVGRSHRLKRYLILLSIVGFAILSGVGVTMILGGADVTVHPKWKDVTVSAVIDAKKNPKAGELGYELLSLSEEGERRVSATGQEKVSVRASGVITITNAFSSTKQRLIKNTRFESPDGYIFRISDSVEIPGYVKEKDGTIKPGTATANVVADGPGETYNVQPSRFTIPGLKGSEQFDKVYAESKDAMSGGFEGLKFIIDEGELSKARQELHLELREKLLARLKNERPNGFVFFDSSVTFAYSSLPPTEAGEQAVVMKEQARLLAPLFKTELFASYIADKTIAGYEGEPVRIEDTSTLTLLYPNTASTSDISLGGTLSFKLDGAIRMIFVYDAEKLRKDLTGIAQTAIPSVMSAYPAIERSRAVIRPFWKDSFPSDIEKIRIVESFETGE